MDKAEQQTQAVVKTPEVRRALPVQQATPDVPYRTGSITGIAYGQTVDVHANPSNSSPTVYHPVKGMTLEITGTVTMNGTTEWVPIRINGTRGWIPRQYVQ